MSVGNRHDAEDLTTQTFLKMLESIGRFRWQLGAVLRVALPDRAQPGDGPLPRHEARGSRRRRCPSPRAAEESSAEDEALQSIGRQSMLELIEDLSHEQQQVLTLKFVFNFSNGEAATILGKTEGAVKSLQHRALASLQKQRRARLSDVALEVGIVGLPAAGKTTLFNALTRAGVGAGLRQGTRRHGADRRRAARSARGGRRARRR